MPRRIGIVACLLGGLTVLTGRAESAVPAAEAFKLTVIVLGAKPQAAELCWRRLGGDAFAKTPLAHVARGVYTVQLPAEVVKGDFEYYVRATADGKSLVFPPTVPAMNQTVVVAE